MTPNGKLLSDVGNELKSSSSSIGWIVILRVIVKLMQMIINTVDGNGDG